jgi:hypothetical protein
MSKKRKRDADRIERAMFDLQTLVLIDTGLQNVLERPEGERFVARLERLAKEAPEHLDALFVGDLGWVAQLGRELVRVDPLHRHMLDDHECAALPTPERAVAPVVQMSVHRKRGRAPESA